MAHRDPIVEEVWKLREQLLVQHGGLEGFLDHIKKEEQKHPEMLVDPGNIKRTVDNKATYSLGQAKK